MTLCKKQIWSMFIAGIMAFNLIGSVVVAAADAAPRAQAAEIQQGTINLREMSRKERKEDQARVREIERLAAQMKEPKPPEEKKEGFWDDAADFFSNLFRAPASNASTRAAPTRPALDEELIAELHFNEAGLDLMSSNYSRTDVDLDIQTPGMAVDISRIYNSKAQPNDLDRMLGYNWKFSFQSRARRKINTGYVVFELPGKNTELFYENDDGEVPMSRDGATFTGDLDYMEGTITTNDQYQYTFEDARLTKIIDPDGNTTKIQYKTKQNTANYEKVIDYLEDPVGGRYTFTYTNELSSEPRVSQITCPDGKKIYYTYNQYSNITRAYGDIKEERNYTYHSYSSVDSNDILQYTKDGEGQILEWYNGASTYQDGYGNGYRADRGHSRFVTTAMAIIHTKATMRTAI